MIIVADSGSTKTDWRVIQGKNSLTTVTKGLNPYFMSSGEMIEELKKNDDLQAIALGSNTIDALYFYGAGLSANDKKTYLRETLIEFFGNVKIIEVASDMLGAARAVLGQSNGVACILGTGSNSCMYDGKKIIQNIPALGYVLGDEGSGADLGKKFLRAYFYGEFSSDIKKHFKDFIRLTDEEIIDAVYKKKLPNRFLASLAPFILKNIHNEQVGKLVEKSFSAFIEKHILPYDPVNKSIGFCGSIAYYFRNELEHTLLKYSLTLGKVTNTPVNQLVTYHCLNC